MSLNDGLTYDNYQLVSNFIDNNGLLKIRTNTSGSIMEVNHHLIDLFRLNKSDCINHNIADLCNQLSFDCPLPALLASGNQIKTYIATKKVAISWDLIKMVDHNKVIGYLLSGKKIINKPINNALLNNNYINSVLNVFPCSVYIENLDNTCVYKDQLNTSNNDELKLVNDSIKKQYDSNNNFTNKNMVINGTIKNSSDSKSTSLYVKIPIRNKNDDIFIFITIVVPLSIWDKANPIKLTSKEKECIPWITSGEPLSEIAKKNHVSKATLESHIAMIKAKCKCKKQFELGYILGKLFPDYL